MHRLSLLMLYLRCFLYFRELYLGSDVIVICESVILRKLKGNSASLVKKKKERKKSYSVPDV